MWEPKAEIPVGHGQTRQAYVVVACLGYSRAGAGAVIFSKQTPDLLFGIRRCLWSLGALLTGPRFSVHRVRELVGRRAGR